LSQPSAHARNLCENSPLEAVQSGAELLRQITVAPSAPACGETAGTPPGLGSRWTLHWSDEFNYEGAPDPTRWRHETGEHGWGNREEQNYTDSIRNSRVENGRLIIEAHQEPSGHMQYSSARLNSIGEGSFTYGKIEIRARAPGGNGLWPAIWMLPTHNGYGRKHWPDGGEIDILEIFGHEPTVNQNSIHTFAYNFQRGNAFNARPENPTLTTEFHNYGIEWTPNRIEFQLDGRPTLVVNRPAGGWEAWPFDQDFHLLLNVAVGGFYKPKGIDPQALPARLEVDYVRVFRPRTPELCRDLERTRPTP